MHIIIIDPNKNGKIVYNSMLACGELAVKFEEFMYVMNNSINVGSFFVATLKFGHGCGYQGLTENGYLWF